MARFRTRARAVDMLGRQQIAGASTAISEIFKNAHDAYAEKVEVDLFRTDDLLVIRDDGFGMTREEFEEKWLVIGTESKVELKSGKSKLYKPHGAAPRAIMGEKGIGRLAIGILGRQVLVLTRAKRDEKLHDLVACYIHWGLFELPGLNIDEIDLPIRTFSDGKLPSESDIQEMTRELKKSVESLSSVTAQQKKSIIDDISDVQLDPSDLDEFLEGLSLKEKGSGTHFYIFPADPTIGEEIDKEKDSESRSFTKLLIGFCNTTFCSPKPALLRTEFRDWESDSEFEALIEDKDFFTNSELEETDHRIKGQIDEYGQFSGYVRVYDKEYENHVISWKQANGVPTNCGPFQIELGYLQGTARETMMPQPEWAHLNAKLKSIGGLYIYRDSLRILPYGDPEFDWARFEERRNLKSSYYFFSHRRMFGAICLTHEDNARLREKAGREGFQSDKAYNQLKSIVENLFIQLAADFFREGASEQANAYKKRKDEFLKLDAARRRQEKSKNTKKKNLQTALDVFFEKTAKGIHLAEVETLKSTSQASLEAAIKIEDPDKASAALLNAEKRAHAKLEEIRSKYRVAKPKGIGLSKPLQRDWDAYIEEQAKIEEKIFQPIAKEIAASLGKLATEAKVYIDHRKRIGDLLKQVAKQNLDGVEDRKREVNQKADETSRKAVRTASAAIQEFKQTVAAVDADFARQNLTKLTVDQIEDLREELENRIEEVGKRNTDTLSSIRDMLTAVAENIDEGVDVTQLDVIEAIESDLESLRSQSDADAELVQLGLAVAIINHEFESTIKSIRKSLREFKGWADANEALSTLYTNIRGNFEHLDGHLNLFTPLQRRLYRNPIQIKGSEIYHYLLSLFEVRLRRHAIELKASSAFSSSNVKGYPSTLYPVFVNLVDNAIHWVTEATRSGGEIVLDSGKGSYLVSNNGKSIHKRDYTSIFEQGFSRKQGGRGLGLFISQRALKKEGMELKLADPQPETGATFQIIWPNSKT